MNENLCADEDGDIIFEYEAQEPRWPWHGRSLYECIEAALAAEMAARSYCKIRADVVTVGMYIITRHAQYPDRTFGFPREVMAAHLGFQRYTTTIRKRHAPMKASRIRLCLKILLEFDYLNQINTDTDCFYVPGRGFKDTCNLFQVGAKIANAFPKTSSATDKPSDPQEELSSGSEVESEEPDFALVAEAGLPGLSKVHPRRRGKSRRRIIADQREARRQLSIHYQRVQAAREALGLTQVEWDAIPNRPLRA